jgi:hypothetical protein
MEKIFSFIGLAILGGLAMVFIVFFGVYFLFVLLGMIAVFALAWACGIPLVITVSGKKEGYIRWFTYHKTKDKYLHKQ